MNNPGSGTREMLMVTRNGIVLTTQLTQKKAQTYPNPPTNIGKVFFFQKPAIRITHPKRKTEVEGDEPFLVNIKPSEALEMNNAVIKLGL